jgi:hypothetical protein
MGQTANLSVRKKTEESRLGLSATDYLSIEEGGRNKPRFLLTSTVITSVNITCKATNGHRFEVIFLLFWWCIKFGEK